MRHSFFEAITIEFRGRPQLEQQAVCGILFPSILLVLSGMVALVYQVLWVKQLSLIVGVDVHAVSICVSAFFAGLALGGIFIGRLSDRVRQPLRLYAMLEFGVALSGVATTVALASSASIFANLENSSTLLAWGYLFIMLLVAPLFMGGTLPAVVRALQLRSERIGSGGGRMYAANTAGGILGAIFSAFYCIPVFGIQGTALVAAAIGVVAGLGGLLLSRFQEPLPANEKKTGKKSADIVKSATLAILLYSIAGGLALGYEVVWSQAIVQFMSTRSFAFSIMLAIYLFGLAVGAALFARYADRIRDHWGIFGFLIAAAGMVALLEISLLGLWLSKLQSMAEHMTLSVVDSKLAAMCARFLVATFTIVFLPTVLLGAAFPAALKLIVDSDHIGRDVGRLVAFNTLGGIIGTIITGFLLIPQFGLVRTLSILSVGAAVLGIVSTQHSSSHRSILRLVVGGVAFVTVLAVFLTPADRLATLLAAKRGGELLFYKEGRGGTVAVLEQHAGTKKFRRLYIQGVSNSGDAMTSLRYMRLQALLPLIIHNGDPKTALVVGFGTGITSGALSRFLALKRRVVAELLPEVIAAGSNFKGNYDAKTDIGLERRLRDGRRELLSSIQQYDLITLEPPPPSAAGVVNLYSSDFYTLARRRLRSHGIVAQWLPLPTQNDSDTRSLVRSFIDIFPYASLWTTEIHEMLLVGSVDPLELNVPRIIDRFTQRAVASSLREVGIASPEALLSTWVTDRVGLAKYANDALPVTDDDPRIEYADWVRSDEIQRTLPNFMELQSDPPLMGADDRFRNGVVAERRRLHLFYQAALNGALGHKDLWVRDMRKVLEADEDNLYYRWFIGDTRQK